MLNSYLSNNSSGFNLYKKKSPSFINSHSSSKIMNRNKSIGNNKEKDSKNKILIPQKQSFIKQKNYSSNKLNHSEINTNKQIKFKKQASSSFYNTKMNYSTFDNSFLNDKNNSVSICQDKYKIFNNSQTNENKETFDQKFKRKKIFSVFTNDLIQNESLGKNTTTDNKFQNYNKLNDIDIDTKENNFKKLLKNTLMNSGSMFNINNNTMKEQPLKLYKENTINNNDNNISYFQTDQNNQKKFSSSLINNPISTNLKNNNNNNLSISINSSNKNIFNKAAKEEFSQKINDIQINLEKNLIENTTNSKSKKYNTIKHAFEDLLVLLQNKKPNHTLNNLLQKLLIGYHEVVSSFSLENRELKQMNMLLKEKNEKVENSLLETIKKINCKKKEVDFLKKKISTMSLDTDSNTNHIINSNDIENNNNIISNLSIFEKGTENEKIYKINKNNLDDLEALYFFDKIKVKHRRSVSHNIPFLKLKKDEKMLKSSPNKNNFNHKFIHHINNKSDNFLYENNNKKYISNLNIIKNQINKFK